MYTAIFLIENIIISSLLYIYLHRKTRISLKYLYIDNIIIIGFSTLINLILIKYLSFINPVLISLFNVPLILGLAFTLTMIRFWRTPQRKIKAKQNEIISPADGNIIYIKKIEKGTIPLSVKKNVTATLHEFINTELLNTPCWIIGINMTPFDVHKNCAPINGEIISINKFKGQFLSLKNPEVYGQNERTSIVIKNEEVSVGVVQTASKLVRRIDTYKNIGDQIKKGEWYGMIRFGSQVDLILPDFCSIKANIGDQIYASKTILASYENIN
jgi:phosphatidylserine decarboxylase